MTPESVPASEVSLFGGHEEDEGVDGGGVGGPVGDHGVQRLGGGDDSLLNLMEGEDGGGGGSRGRHDKKTRRELGGVERGMGEIGWKGWSRGEGE